MSRIRTQLIAAFLAATLLPLVVTLAITASLLDFSLSYATTDELDKLSRSLEETGRELYQQARESLKKEAGSGRPPHEVWQAADRRLWPQAAVEFWESGEDQRFALSGDEGNRLEYLLRHDDAVHVFARPLGVRMERLTTQYRDARALVESARTRDLRQGLRATLVSLVAAVWLVAFAWLVYLANRMSRPIQQLTAGLSELAAGNFDARIDVKRGDELGRAINAFNHTAGTLEQNRDRLVYLTQIASWQVLARKMAHELKNSLTPIRLTVEEMLARQNEPDKQFMERAVQIVVNEIESLERRVRAFSDFSSEPVVRITAFAVNALIEERVSLLKPGRPGVEYCLELREDLPEVKADEDRVRGILTNLLENAADAVGRDGRVLVCSYATAAGIHVEIHDSGPGLSEHALKTLFEPAITFKSGGMGLGLSIARKDALVCGGDLKLVDGRLGGAAFRLVLARA